MGCFGGESEKTKLKRAKQREKAEKKKQQMQPWNDERQLNALSHRTRTHPATGQLPFVDPRQMKPRTEAQNTYYVSRFRTDLVGKEKSMRHITKAEVLHGITQGPPPGHKVDPKSMYPKLHENGEGLLPVRPDNYYWEYPVHGAQESKHSRGPDFQYSDHRGKKTSPWRAITNSNQQYEGILIHNHPQHIKSKDFHQPDVYYIGARPSDAQMQPGRLQQIGRSKTQANGFEEPFVRSRR